MEINLIKPRNGRLLADTFSLVVDDSQDWHGAELRLLLRGLPLGTARVITATRVTAERLTDQSCLIATGMDRMKVKELFMAEFRRDIHPETRFWLLTLRWESRDLETHEHLFKEQWEKLVEQKELKIQNSAA